jgi:L-2-hydroxyglutarate oxidase
MEQAMMPGKKADMVIVGAGIIGLATAYKYLLKNRGLNLIILEKEMAIASHQTSHNSGVIHSGIYYRPGSLKAKNCIDGASQLYQFCQQENIPFKSCGKLIIATQENELPRLEGLYQNGLANGLNDLEMVSPARIREIEPMVIRAIKGVYNPHTSIIDFLSVAQALQRKVLDLGGTIVTNCECLKIGLTDQQLVIETSQGEICSQFLVNCAGTWADHVAKSAGLSIAEKMIPFRGEYYRLSPEAAKKIRGLIYPLADPAFPFLGVHLTRKMDGSVEAGPNAVLALAKNGYEKSTISLSHCLELAIFPGFWKMALRHWKTGFYEVYRSFRKQAFLESLQRLIPDLKAEDLLSDGAGVRAQLVMPNGALCNDFVIKKTERMIHLLNAPSPAATACLSIADTVLDMINDS